MHTQQKQLMVFILGVVFLAFMLFFQMASLILNKVPGYPWSMIGLGALLIVILLGISMSRLWRARAYQRLPRLIHFIGALLLVIALAQAANNVLFPQYQSIPSAIPSSSFSYVLGILPIFLMLGASLFESFLEKPDRKAWGRAIGMALIAGIFLFVILLVITAFL